MTCETCQFYQPNSLENGACVRYPPYPQLSGTALLRFCFPYVAKGGWCGEYKANERDAPKPKKTA